jgi:hypothetical protein
VAADWAVTPSQKTAFLIIQLVHISSSGDSSRTNSPWLNYWLYQGNCGSRNFLFL